MPDGGMTDNENAGSRSRLGRPWPHDLRFGVNPIGITLFTVLITLGYAEGFSPGSEALSGRALGAVFKVSQPYGAVDKEVNATPGGVHAGIDFAAAQGTRVQAVRNGAVIAAGGPSGTVAVFDGENTVLYIHMQDIDVSKLNERITVGAFLGTVGRVGATGVHLHIEVRKGRHEVGIGCTVDEYVKMRKWPKGYCDSPRRVADLTLDPVEYLVGGKQQEARPPATKEGKTVKDGGINVTWSVSAFWRPRGEECTKGGLHEVEGRVPATVDLTDDRIAKMLIEMGKKYARARCGMNIGVRSVSLFTPTYENGQEVAVVWATGIVDEYKNYMAWHTCWIKPFLEKYRVDVWIGSPSMAQQFIANPFQWERKIVGFRAEYERMVERNTGVFTIAESWTLAMNPIAVTHLPPTRFVKPQERALLAGRVQGTQQGVPILSFVGAESAPPKDQVPGTPGCTSRR